MLLLDLPDDLVVRICSSLICVYALAALSETCERLRHLIFQENMWSHALFVTNGTWNQLKDVALTVRYMHWSNRVPSPLPAFIATMDNVAFWGTLSENDKTIATFGPCIPKFDTDLELPLEFDPIDTRNLWVSFVGDIEWTDTDLFKEYVSIDPDEEDPERWLKCAKLDMYVLVLFNGTTGIYNFKSGIIDPDISEYGKQPEIGLNYDGDVDHFFRFWSNQIEFILQDGEVEDENLKNVTTEWKTTFLSADEDKRSKMQIEFADNAAKQDRGWGNTRKDIIEIVLKHIK